MCEARASVSKAPVHRLFDVESYWESQGALICISNVAGSAVGQMVWRFCCRVRELEKRPARWFAIAT